MAKKYWVFLFCTQILRINFLYFSWYSEYPENTGYSRLILRYSESVFDFPSILRIPRKYWVFSLYTQILRTRFGYSFNTQNTQKILGILFIYSDTQNPFLISLRYSEYPENTGYSLFILRIPRKYWVFSFYSQNTQKILGILF